MTDRDRTVQIGTVLTLGGASTAELFAEAFDFVWIDLEHAALSTRDAQEMIVGAQAAGARSLVRLPHRAVGAIAQVLDAGADGVVLADVADAGEARRAIAGVLHPPRGTRGWGPRRLSTRGRSRGVAAQEPTVWAQIESVAGLRNARSIAEVAGVDALVVGTADLSFARGVPLAFGSAELLDAVRLVARAAQDGGVQFGVAGPLVDAAPEITADAAFLVHSTDARIAAAAVDAAVRTLVAQHRPGGTP